MEKTLKITKKFLNVEKPDGTIVKIFLKRLRVCDNPVEIDSIEKQLDIDYSEQKISDLEYFKGKFELITDNLDFSLISDLTNDELADIFVALTELLKERRTIEEKKSQG